MNVPAVAVLGAVFHVPVMAGVLVEEVGRLGAVLPTQTFASGLKVGVVLATTVSELEAVVTHVPELGVKVYVNVPAAAVLGAVFHVPVIAGVLVEEVGRVGAVPPTQTLVSGLNVGVVLAITVSELEAVVTQVPDDGVNV